MVQQSILADRRRSIIRPRERLDSSIEVVVIHTTTRETLKALRTAAELAHGLRSHIRLLVLEVVPYALPLNEPQVPLEFTEQRFRTMALDASVDTLVDIRLGRDREEMMEAVLKPNSTVVMGGPRGWWPTKENRMAKRLERAGHQVLFAGGSL